MDIEERQEIVRDSLKKYMGLPPYNTASNVCMNDGYFYQGIIREHGKRLVQRIANELETSFISTSDERATDTATSNEQSEVTPVKVVNFPAKDTPAKKPRVTLDCQAEVDKYIRLHEEYKKIEKQLEELRKVIEPALQESNLVKVNGTQGGSVQVITQERPNVTGRYSTYELEDIEQFLSAKAKKACIVKRIDREKLEALMKIGEVDEELQELKRLTPQVSIRVNHQ